MFKKLISAVLAVFLVTSCVACSRRESSSGPGSTDSTDSTDSPDDARFSNTLFPHSIFIETGIPELNDTVLVTPTFTWKATGNKLVYLAIFSKKFSMRYESSSITNVSDNIWAWHSGLGKAREGNVSFTDGVNVINGELQEGKPVAPLESGKGYYWAVWAWNDDGTKVTHSSKEMYFIAK